MRLRCGAAAKSLAVEVGADPRMAPQAALQAIDRAKTRALRNLLQGPGGLLQVALGMVWPLAQTRPWMHNVIILMI